MKSEIVSIAENIFEHVYAVRNSTLTLVHIIFTVGVVGQFPEWDRPPKRQRAKWVLLSRATDDDISY